MSYNVWILSNAFAFSSSLPIQAIEQFARRRVKEGEFWHKLRLFFDTVWYGFLKHCHCQWSVSLDEYLFQCDQSTEQEENFLCGTSDSERKMFKKLHANANISECSKSTFIISNLGRLSESPMVVSSDIPANGDSVQREDAYLRNIIHYGLISN